MVADMKHKMKYGFIFVLICVHPSTEMPSQMLLNEDVDQGKDVAAIILSNLYEPNKSGLAKHSVIAKDSDDDTTMFISKLSDDELVSFLQKNQKQDISDDIDAINVQNNGVTNKAKKLSHTKGTKEHSRHDQMEDSNPGSAFFRIDEKEVEPFNVKVGADPHYLAQQKIKNLLHSAPVQNLVDLSSEETEENKEIMFNILTAQLKKLCCKSPRSKQKRVKLPSYEPLLIISDSDKKQSTDTLQYEQMFLIVNDEIESTEGSDIIYVDPDSLSQNSSVILLGPITTPLSDSQLNVVMNRITSELSRPEYDTLLQGLAEGKVKENNSHLLKSLVSGSNTRRFIKPHRCNQRYPSSQGPKWLICTGYLNLNTPSLYD